MLGDKKIIGLVPITDAARAKAFYAEKLGLKFVSEDPFALVFDANGNMLAADEGEGIHTAAVLDTGLGGG